MFETCLTEMRSRQNQMKEILKTINPSDGRKLDRYFQSEVKARYFSDTIVLFAPIADGEGGVVVSDLFRILTAVAGTMIATLAAGYPIRGGIELGVGTEFKEEIYGPVLQDAYALESKCAEYPRIVVGDELIKFTEFVTQQPSSDAWTRMNQAAARQIKALLTQDDDGHFVLDYLAEVARELLEGDAAAGDAVKGIVTFANNEHRRFVQERNQKLALRYARLKRYCLSRAPAWGVEVES